MKKIASFQIDHTKLMPGVYISRVGGDIVTYDLRFVRPNMGRYLENDAIHTVEHLFATYARDGEYADKVVYFGPMGCRTGFYFLTRNLPHDKALALIKSAVKFIRDYDGEIPGCTAVECGNYLEHDLEKAKAECTVYYDVIKDLSTENLNY